MKVYDKASWHIDGGEKKADVIARFREVFEFLQEKKMLNAEGIETLEYAMDSSVSLNSKMLNTEGKDFIDCYYEEVIEHNPKKIRKNLLVAYKKFMDED